MPRATVKHAGTGGQNQIRPKWIADELVARGQGKLEVLPAFGRAVEFPSTAQSVIIR